MRPISEAPAHLLFGVTFLPEDFPQRLNRFKAATGLTWDALAGCLGVDPRQLERWRRGTKPCGDGLFALLMLAARIPGGVHMLLGVHVSPPLSRSQMTLASLEETSTPGPSTSSGRLGRVTVAG